MVNLNRMHTRTKSGKEIPEGTLVEISHGGDGSHVRARIRLPTQMGWTDLGRLEIIDNAVTLPVLTAFLMYAREDEAFVEDLSIKLLSDGILTWWDQEDLLPGDRWERVIDKAIQGSDFIVVFLSKKSVDKIGQFQRELKYAIEQSKLRPSDHTYIIPLIINDALCRTSSLTCIG